MRPAQASPDRVLAYALTGGRSRRSVELSGKIESGDSTSKGVSAMMENLNAIPGINDSLRSASETTQFPYASNRVPFLVIGEAGSVHWTTDRDAKYQLCQQATGGGRILAIWPQGDTSSVYQVDDARAALSVLEKSGGSQQQQPT